MIVILDLFKRLILSWFTRIFCILLVFFVNDYTNAELIKDKDAKPFIPSVMGVGNGAVAQASGITSLWINPAGLAVSMLQHDKNDTEITALSMTLQSQPYPTELYETVMTLLTVSENGVDESVVLLAGKENLRLGVSLYGGATFLTRAGGFGVAFTNTANVFSYSYASPLSITGLAIQQSELMFGYAYPFVKRDLKVNLGVAVRPLLRTRVDLQPPTVLSSVLTSTNVPEFMDRVADVFQGFAFGFDVGMQLRWKGLLFGLVTRDIYTPIFYRNIKVPQLLTIGVSEGVINDFYMIPLTVDVGIGYQYIPKGTLGNFFNVLVYAQLTDAFNAAPVNNYRTEDYIKHLHMGLELAVIPPFFNIQAGINQGYVTFGLGADIWILDIAFVVYTQEEGAKLLDMPSSGMGFEVGFRW